ncbi:MAG TPA: L-aspartate oxidase [Caulobacterales bacterium]|nr:L-aspartate oxidase [Caulobacterales bacterium]
MAERSDIVIVGAGLAGLFLALKLAPRPVRVLSQAPLGQASSSAWAQGGLAVAIASGDNADLHAEDTIKAGAGLVDPVVAHLLAEEGPARVIDLIGLGVPFDRTPDGKLAQSLEAAHSRPRVVRVSGDLAGKAIMEALTHAVRAATHIEVMEGMAARALMQDANGAVCGVICRANSDQVVSVEAAEVVLATGGIGGLYAVTTNPPEARGHGLAMSARVGALIADSEFVQFHPTAIDIGRDPAPLATEALRGEGAKLVNDRGASFVSELAPRDVVARAIHNERIAGRGAYLDCTKAIGAKFPKEFPTVFAACMYGGVDPRTTPIPVAPAAHYHMGGVASDLWGRATVEGLSVVGECASTGAHGANRLASNSLLEAVVFAHRIAERLRDSQFGERAAAQPRGAPPELAFPARASLRELMQRDVGVVRDEAGLVDALDRTEKLCKDLGPANELAAARMIIAAALARRESRGGHYRSDYPHAGAQKRTFITAGAALTPAFA